MSIMITQLINPSESWWSWWLMMRLSPLIAQEAHWQWGGWPTDNEEGYTVRLADWQWGRWLRLSRCGLEQAICLTISNLGAIKYFPKDILFTVILPNRPTDNEAGGSGAAQAGPAWNRPAESARPPPIFAAARQGIFLWISYLYSIWFRRWK